MPEKFLAAAVQMCSGEDVRANLDEATRLIEQAAAAGAQIVAMPEMFACFGRWEVMLASAEPVPGPTSDALSTLAARLRITLVGGSICERASTPGKAHNTSLLFGPDGQLLARYRKIHLFDVDLPGQVTVQESRWLAPGIEAVATWTPLTTIGQAICYDLRFPAVFERMAEAGCDLLCIPSAFTATTGRDHWELLLRSRAVESQAYVVAPNQTGQHAGQFTAYGHSAIVDPWGNVLAMAQEEVGYIAGEIDLSRLRDVRARLPALRHRREIDPARPVRRDDV